MRRLPALKFECPRCGVRIEHSTDTKLITRLAAHHVAVAHADAWHAVDLLIRWSGSFLDAETQDDLLTHLCDELGSAADVWVDESKASFVAHRYVTTERLLELVADVIGAEDLEVVDITKTIRSAWLEDA